MTKEQLEQAIITHEKWIKSSGAEGARLHAVGWDLSGADLSERDLSFAVLDEANLQGAKVRGGMCSVLALEFWENNDLIDVKAKVVDGKKILPNIWYRLDSSGRFVKAGDENCE